MLEKIVRAKEELDKVKSLYRDVVIAAQLSCLHDKLYECEYTSSGSFGYALRPMRVCNDCGLSEEGWGCGYTVLIGEAITISRENVYEKRIGPPITEGHKGPLIRCNAILKKKVLEAFLHENRNSI